MAKRRTRAEKNKANYAWLVNRQFKKDAEPRITQELERKSAKVTANKSELATPKGSIVKSLILASVILALEVVIYLSKLI